MLLKDLRTRGLRSIPTLSRTLLTEFFLVDAKIKCPSVVSIAAFFLLLCDIICVNIWQYRHSMRISILCLRDALLQTLLAPVADLFF